MQARPKVMRRPAYFSHPPAPVVTSTAVIPADFPSLAQEKAQETEAATATRSWQDDGRFAIVLLAIVALVNLGVVLWLQSLNPKPAKPIHIIQDSRMSTGTPDGTDTPPDVSVYTGTSPEVHVLDSKARPASE